MEEMQVKMEEMQVKKEEMQVKKEEMQVTEDNMERQVNGGQYGETSEWRAIWRDK